MTITASAVMAEMQVRTGRTDVTNIDDELKAILVDLSLSWPFLQTSGTVTITANTYSTDLPTGYRTVRNVVGLSQISLPELMRFRQFETTTGTPVRYALFNDDIYVHPTPATNTTLTLFYDYVSNNIATIAFPDEFAEAIIEGVCFKTYEGKGMLGSDPAAAAHLDLYREQKELLKARYADRSL